MDFNYILKFIDKSNDIMVAVRFYTSIPYNTYACNSSADIVHIKTVGIEWFKYEMWISASIWGVSNGSALVDIDGRIGFLYISSYLNWFVVENIDGTRP